MEIYVVCFNGLSTKETYVKDRKLLWQLHALPCTDNGTHAVVSTNRAAQELVQSHARITNIQE